MKVGSYFLESLFFLSSFYLCLSLVELLGRKVKIVLPFLLLFKVCSQSKDMDRIWEEDRGSQ